MRRISATFAASLPIGNLKSRHSLITQTIPKMQYASHQTAASHQRARMQAEASPTYPTLLPTLVVEDAEAALTYYTSALEATIKRVERSEGRVLHSLIETYYGLRLSIVDYFPGCLVDPLAPGGLVQGLFQYVTIPAGGCDKAVERMVAVGGTLVERPEDSFYGQRIGKVVDRYGVAWIFAHDL